MSYTKDAFSCISRNIVAFLDYDMCCFQIAAGIQPLQNVRVLGYVNAKEPDSASEVCMVISSHICISDDLSGAIIG